MSIKRILGLTGIRSDYDLMSLIYKEMNNKSDFEIGLIVSGAHLSETYGYTYKQIQADNIPIVAEIENLIDSNSKSARLKSLSILLQDCIHDVERFKPDAIIFAGDREEVMIGALLGAYLRIPTMHFFGGDHASDGNVDNVVRHAASKLSSIHFVTHEQAKRRLIKMGEEPFRIFNMGSPALDKFADTKYIEKKELLKSMNSEHIDKYVVVIFHSIIGQEEKAGEYFEEILISLKEKDINAFISYPNVDPGNKDIINIINKYKNDESFYFYKNLDRDKFINLLRNCEFIIGNSSLGLYEAPLIKKGAINVGDRQKGRLAAKNVIFVDQGISNIKEGINKVLSNEFKSVLENVKSLYGDGESVRKIVECIGSLDLNNYLTKNIDPLFMEE